MRAERVSSEHDDKDEDEGGDDNQCNETTTTPGQRTTRVKANTTRQRGRRQWHESNNQSDGDNDDGTRSTVRGRREDEEAGAWSGLRATNFGRPRPPPGRKAALSHHTVIPSSRRFGAGAMVTWRDARTRVVRVGAIEDEGGRRGAENKRPNRGRRPE